MQKHPLIGVPSYAPFVYEVVFSVFPTLQKLFGLPSGGHSDQVPLLPFTNRQISERVRLSYYSPSTVCGIIINTKIFIRQAPKFKKNSFWDDSVQEFPFNKALLHPLVRGLYIQTAFKGVGGFHPIVTGTPADNGGAGEPQINSHKNA